MLEVKKILDSLECVKQIEFLIVGQVLTKKELVNLEAEDILQSTIFNKLN
jgi:hypothetical protein